MKYKIQVRGSGCEFAIGSVPDEIWDYIHEEFDGDADAYFERVSESIGLDEEDEDYIPEELRPWEDPYENDGLAHENRVSPSDCRIEVLDENGESVDSLSLADLELSEKTERISPEESSQRIMVWKRELCGLFFKAEIETDEPFDAKKLNAFVEHYCFGENRISVVAFLRYDGKYLDTDYDYPKVIDESVTLYDLNATEGGDM